LKINIKINNKTALFTLGNWTINIWKTHGFSFLFHYEWKWNSGTEKRLYLLWWEINISKEEEDE